VIDEPAGASPVQTPGADDPRLFEMASEVTGGIRRQLNVEKLIALEQAAAAVVQPVARLWGDLVHSADQATSERALDSVLRDLLSSMSRLLGVNTVAILLANEAGDELVARAAVGLSEELTLGLGIRAGQGMSGSVLASRRPLVVGDLSAIHVVNPVLRESGLRSVAAVPLPGQDHPLGVLYAASYERDRFTAADAELLELVAGRVGAALERVRLFEAERAARREAERLADRVLWMQDATSRLAAAASRVAVAAAVAACLGSGRDARALLYLAPAAAAHVPEADDAASHEGGPAVQAVGAAGAGPEVEAAVLDALADGLARFGPGPPAAYAVVPLPASAGPAALAVVYRGPADFPPDERILLASVAVQAGQALDRVRLADAERRAGRRAAFFARAAQLMAQAGGLAATLQQLAELTVESLGEICLIDLVDEAGGISRMAVSHRDRALQPIVDRLRSEFGPDPTGRHPAADAVRNGRTRWARTMTAEFLRATSLNDDHLALIEALGFRSYLTVPLAAGDRVLGAVTSVSTSRSFTPADIDFAEELARHVAAVVDNARRHDAASQTSQILQSSLLPASLPELPDLEVATRYLTANRGIEVGGDFYDLLALPSGLVLFAIGDVAGHDRWAAAQMGHLRSALRALAGQVDSPAELLGSLRWSWELLGFDRIATALVGTLDLDSGDLHLASAGHYPPLVLGPGGASFLPVAPSPPLGVGATGTSGATGRLERGDVLVCYTDGAVDERVSGSVASMGRLAAAAARGDHSPEAVLDRLVATLGDQRADDVAFVALRRRA
jgi:serine/threonine-protein kinase RsbW